MKDKVQDDPGGRRRHRNYLLFFVIALVALIWPGLAIVSDPAPLVIGLPLPLAWIIAWLMLLFLVLIRLYRADTRNGRDE